MTLWGTSTPLWTAPPGAVDSPAPLVPRPGAAVDNP